MARRALRQTRPLAVAAAAGLLALLALASLAFEHEREGEAALPETGWSVEVAEGYEYADFVIAISDRPAPGFEGHHGTGGRIVLLHPRSGERMATIHTSYAPMAVRRASAKQLLVSDIVWVEEEGGEVRGHSRLLVFNLDGGVELGRVVPLPNRGSYKFYSPGIVGLSGDERHFFYFRHGRDERGDEQRQWYVLDLERPESEPEPVAGARGCNIHITPGEGDTALVQCGEVMRISAGGEVLDAAPIPGSGLPFAGPDGMLGQISGNGLAEARVGGRWREARIFPPNSLWLSRPRAVRSTGQVLMGYRSDGGNVLHGFVEFDPATWDVRHAGLDALDIAPGPYRDDVWVLRTDGTIARFTWGTPAGSVRPLGNEPLFPPRVEGSGDYEWQNWALIP